MALPIILAPLHHSLEILLILSTQCRLPPINQHPTIAPPVQSKLFGNTIKSGCLNPNPPSLVYISFPHGSWKLLPSSAHAKAPKKHLPHVFLESFAKWFGPSRESLMQPRPPPAPNIDLFVKVCLLALRIGKQSLNLSSNYGRPSKQSPLSMIQLLSPTPPKMTTCQATAEKTRQLRRKQAAKLMDANKMEQQCLEQVAKKKERDRLRKVEEDARKQQEDEE